MVQQAQLKILTYCANYPDNFKLKLSHIQYTGQNVFLNHINE